MAHIGDPNDPWDDHLVFVFDGGTLDHQQASLLTSSDPEISAYQFATIDGAEHLLRADIHQRFRQAYQALTTATTAYDEISRRW